MSTFCCWTLPIWYELHISTSRCQWTPLIVFTFKDLVPFIKSIAVIFLEIIASACKYSSCQNCKKKKTVHLKSWQAVTNCCSPNIKKEYSNSNFRMYIWIINCLQVLKSSMVQKHMLKTTYYKGWYCCIIILSATVLICVFESENL